MRTLWWTNLVNQPNLMSTFGLRPMSYRKVKTSGLSQLPSESFSLAGMGCPRMRSFSSRM